MSKNKILFQLTGSIACFKACQLLSRLVQKGFEVEVVATPSALKFVGEATLEGLTGKRVHTETFAAGSYMDHIHLIRWADLVLLCPATANSINKLASGIGDDLVSTLFLAHDFKKPYLIAPAMNTRMLEHPSTQSSLKKLTDWGIEILGSGKGSLACGEVGDGRLLEPEELFTLIESRLAVKASGLEVLVTSGGTAEPIDGVRSITNFSTGKTGAAIAHQLTQEGHRVTLLRASSAVPAQDSEIRQIEFTSFSDLEEKIKKELGSRSYDTVIHAAAVGDFSVDSVEVAGRKVSNQGKIESDAAVVLKLKRNPKLVESLREFSKNKNIQVVAFKLTNTKDENERSRAIAKLAENAKPDYIVHNDLSEIEGENHQTRFYVSREPKQLREVAQAPTKSETVRTLERLIKSGAEV